ncbi:MAG: enoyl-CoA hydratase/isomerase family protein [Novosphingobium sp.]
MPAAQDGPGFLLESIGAVPVFKINRPHRLNALTRGVLYGLSDFLDRAEEAGKSVVVITAGGGRAFCAGTDLDELMSLSDEEALAKADFARNLMGRLNRSSVFSIAAINGLAFGGGLELAMGCAMRIAVDSATFSLPEIKLGVLPSYGGTQLLPALVGRSRARELMVTGRTLSAHDALLMGLIDEVVSAEAALVAHIETLGTNVESYSRDALASLKTCIDASGEDLRHGFAVEREEVGRISVGADAKEGVRAFLEKRQPCFNKGHAE